jgi:hypothetical protein
MRLRHLIFLLNWLVLSACMRHSVSGKYLAKFDNGVYWLQLIETKDGHVSGQFESAVLNPDGKVATSDWSVTGAADGGDVSLSLQPVPGIPLFQTVSGTLNCGRLSLTGKFTGEQSRVVDMLPSEQHSFQRELDDLNTRSRTILLAKAKAEARLLQEQRQRDLTGALRDVVLRMKRFEAQSQEKLPTFSLMENRFFAITSKMGSYLERERQLRRNPDVGVARSQIVVAMNQGVIAANQVHNDVYTLALTFKTNVGPLSEAVSEFERTCSGYHPSDNTRFEEAAWNTTCREFFVALPSFRHNFDVTGQALGAVEQVYLREHEKQSSLIQEAESIQ